MKMIRWVLGSIWSNKWVVDMGVIKGKRTKMKGRVGYHFSKRYSNWYSIIISRVRMTVIGYSKNRSTKKWLKV